MELDLDYWNQNVRGRQGLRKGQSLILCTVGKLLCDSHETMQKNSVEGAYQRKLNVKTFPFPSTNGGTEDTMVGKAIWAGRSRFQRVSLSPSCFI